MASPSRTPACSMLAPSSRTFGITAPVHAHPLQQIFGGSGFLDSPATHTTGSGPALTASLTTSGVGPFCPPMQIQIVVSGLLGTSMFEYSFDNGTIWSAPIPT